jgi:hypothetical protein
MEHRRTAQCSDGADRERIFTDTASGKLARRPQPLDPVLDHERSVPFTDVEQAHKLALTPAAAEKVVGRGGRNRRLRHRTIVGAAPGAARWWRRSMRPCPGNDWTAGKQQQEV